MTEPFHKQYTQVSIDINSNKIETKQVPSYEGQNYLDRIYTQYGNGQSKYIAIRETEDEAVDALLEHFSKKLQETTAELTAKINAINQYKEQQ